jgi:hypothetical protein
MPGVDDFPEVLPGEKKRLRFVYEEAESHE